MEGNWTLLLSDTSFYIQWKQIWWGSNSKFWFGKYITKTVETHVVQDWNAVVK